MLNAKTTINKDGIMTIKVDLNQEHGMSGSGKTVRIATSGKATSPDEESYPDVRVNLNVYKFPERK